MSMTALKEIRLWSAMGLQGVPGALQQSRQDTNMILLKARYGWLFPGSDRQSIWRDPENVIYMFYDVPRIMSETYLHSVRT